MSMSTPRFIEAATAKIPFICTARPEGPNERQWLVDGFPATVTIWTPEEWDAQQDKPGDSQEYPNGTRATLRIA